MKNILNQLEGGDLQSIGNVNRFIPRFKSQSDFDELFGGLFHLDRRVVMRAADAIEKLTTSKKEFLTPHKFSLIRRLNTADQKELKWHLALIVPRLPLTARERGAVWDVFTRWARDHTESRIVRVNALQALFDICAADPRLKTELVITLQELERQNIPSLNARIRKLTKHW